MIRKYRSDVLFDKKKNVYCQSLDRATEVKPIKEGACC